MTILAATQSNVFDQIKRTDANGEYWSARELMTTLGYSTWAKFVDALDRARASCENSGHNAPDHFAPSGKMIRVGKGGTREVEDFRLTRYACYLTAMNGDARKAEIAGAQMYFAIQTRKAETAPVLNLTALQQLADLVPQAIEARVQVAEARMEAQIEQWQAEQPINSIQKGQIHRAVKELALLMGGKPRDFRRAWTAFKDHYGLAAYPDLPSGKYDDALRFISKMAAAYENPRALEFVNA